MLDELKNYIKAAQSVKQREVVVQFLDDNVIVTYLFDINGKLPEETHRFRGIKHADKEIEKAVKFLILKALEKKVTDTKQTLEKINELLVELEDMKSSLLGEEEQNEEQKD